MIASHSILVLISVRNKCICGTTWCSDLRQRHPVGQAYFTVPSAEKEKGMWLKFLGLSSMDVKKSSRVCAVHFHPCDLRVTSRGTFRKNKTEHDGYPKNDEAYSYAPCPSASRKQAEDGLAYFHTKRGTGGFCQLLKTSFSSCSNMYFFTLLDNSAQQQQPQKRRKLVAATRSIVAAKKEEEERMNTFLEESYLPSYRRVPSGKLGLAESYDVQLKTHIKFFIYSVNTTYFLENIKTLYPF